MVFWFHTCKDSLRTIPVLQHDKTNAEDLDSDSEDHAADQARYACMSRPFTRAKPKPADITRQPTLDELMAAHKPATGPRRI